MMPIMTSTSSLHTLRTSVADASRRLAAAGLLIGSAGNVSARAGDYVALTPTGAVLAEVEPDQICVLTLDGTQIEGELAPTSEAALHLGVYRVTPSGQVGAVVHTHAPRASAISLVLDELPVVHYQQLTLGGAIRVAPFHPFGSPELAAAVGAALDGRLAAIMANHGAVTLGGDLTAAVENALLLEWLCELYLRASSIGTPRTLTPEQQAGVIAAATRMGYGATRRVQP